MKKNKTNTQSEQTLKTISEIDAKKASLVVPGGRVTYFKKGFLSPTESLRKRQRYSMMVERRKEREERERSIEEVKNLSNFEEMAEKKQMEKEMKELEKLQEMLEQRSNRN